MNFSCMFDSMASHRENSQVHRESAPRAPVVPHPSSMLRNHRSLGGRLLMDLSFLYEKPLNRTYMKNSSKIVGDVDFTEKLIFFMIWSVFLKILNLSPSIGKADDFINF